MSQTDETNKDNLIADFADSKRTASSSDPELVRLEETIQHLKQSMPTSSINSATSKQMLVRLKARIKREEEAQKPSIWKRLFDFQSNPQVGMILAVAMVVIIAIVSVPSLQLSGGAVTGTAGNSNSILFAGVLVLVLLVAFWFTRRK
jgi:LPXTG-motif cell wall-anchored protein